MQAQLMDPNDQPKSSWNGFNDLPAELRNQIYHYRTVFNNSNGDRRIFTVKEFRIRYQLHISLLRASSEIAKELKPIILGSHTLHLKVNRNYGSSLFANDQWDIISYTRRSDVLHSTHMEVPPSKLRPFSEHLKITLEAPMETKEEVGKQLKRKLQDSERAWSVSEDDWLYPVRELKAIGFERVEELEIEVKYQPRTLSEVTNTEVWTRSCVAGMELSAKTYKIVFKEWVTGRS